MSQALTNLIPGTIFVAIFLFIFGIYYARMRRAQIKIASNQEKIIANQERQTVALERIASTLESFKGSER
jgi:hypothetical protein